MVLLAGERSGDVLGAQLAAALPEARLFGLCGPAMRAAGVEPLARLDQLGFMGLPVRQVPRLVALLAGLRRQILALRPQVVVSIDSPSLFLRWGRGLGTPRLHWVSPQIWAWRRHRAARIARSVDTLACLFPFEPALYGQLPVRARFVGHPGAAGPMAPLGTAVGLVAGSRRKERERLGPLFREALAGLPVVEAVPAGMAPVLPDAEHVTGAPALAGRVRGALVCSGTATLELAARGVPQVAAYPVGRLTRTFAPHLLRVQDISLPNLVLGRSVVPELLGDPDPTSLRRALEGVLAHPGVQRAAFAELPALLQPASAVERVAAEVRLLARTR